MNIRKWLCKYLKGWLFRLFDCNRYSKKISVEPEIPKPNPEPEYITVKVCLDSGMLAGNYCPISRVVEKKFIKDSPLIPNDYCSVHYKKKPIRKRLERNPKPAGTPLFSIAILDLHQRMHDRQKLEELLDILGKHGVDEIRIFLTGWDEKDRFTGREKVTPFKKGKNGKWLLDKPNPDYDEAIRELKALAWWRWIRISGDLFDQCMNHQANDPWNYFKNNNIGITSFYDSRPETISFFIENWIKRFKKLDIELRLGNELRHPDERDPSKLYSWAENWAVPYARYISEFQSRLRFSADRNTGHKIMGFLSPEEHPELFNYNFPINQAHGLGLVGQYPPDFPSEDLYWRSYSKVRWYEYSDDGVGTQWWNKIPEDKRGLCGRGGKCCSASVDERIKMVARFLSYVNHVYSIEFLPREIADEEPLDRFDIENSAMVYIKLARRLYGLEIRRKF